jgi:hypothetical protein
MERRDDRAEAAAVAALVPLPLYVLEHASWLVVTGTYDNGPECL